MDDEDQRESPSPVGLPGWIATFADMMTLLLCFFVLLLAMSDTNAKKYQRVAGAMANAFGVQAEFETIVIPKGTSIIAEQFSPGTPDPTPMNKIRQKTNDNQRESLEVQCQDTGSSNSGEQGEAQKQIIVDKIQDLVGETEQEAIEIATALSKEIKEGIIEVETSGRKIVVRIKEHGTFPSGSSDLTPDFTPVLKIIRQALADTEGSFVVEGHTDPDPIATTRFRSNWALSAARAVTVAHALFDEGKLTQDRFAVSGHADTRPLVANDTPAGKARNRRVEVLIDQGLNEEVKEDLEVIRAEDPGLYQEIKSELIYRFELQPEEVF